MKKGKKYNFRVIQDNSTWVAEIIRRASSSKTVVSKRQEGFSTESDAQAWGESELKTFLQSLADRNERRAKRREQG